MVGSSSESVAGECRVSILKLEGKVAWVLESGCLDTVQADVFPKDVNDVYKILGRKRSFVLPITQNRVILNASADVKLLMMLSSMIVCRIKYMS